MKKKQKKKKKERKKRQEANGQEQQQEQGQHPAAAAAAGLPPPSQSQTKRAWPDPWLKMQLFWAPKTIAKSLQTTLEATRKIKFSFGIRFCGRFQERDYL